MKPDCKLSSIFGQIRLDQTNCPVASALPSNDDYQCPLCARSAHFHTHLPLDVSIPPPPKGKDNIITGGRAALAGGITTLGDFIRIENNEDPNAFADRNIALIEKNSIADVYIHAS